MQRWQVATTGPEQTRQLGGCLGRLAEAGLTIFLDGELGAGKTCLTQGIAEGLGVDPEEPVTSPTYTLMNHYHGRLELFHFDLYRIGHEDELVDIDFEETAAAGGVTVVEWANRALDPRRSGLHVALAHAGPDQRSLVLNASGAAAEELLAKLATTWNQQGEAP